MQSIEQGDSHNVKNPCVSWSDSRESVQFANPCELRIDNPETVGQWGLDSSLSCCVMVAQEGDWDESTVPSFADGEDMLTEGHREHILAEGPSQQTLNP